MFLEAVSGWSVLSEKKLQNKHLIFSFGSRWEISIFQKYFTEPKTLYDDQIFPVITHWTFTWLSPWALQQLYQTTGCPFLTCTPLNSLIQKGHFRQNKNINPTIFGNFIGSYFWIIKIWLFLVVYGFSIVKLILWLIRYLTLIILFGILILANWWAVKGTLWIFILVLLIPDL